MFSDDKMVMLTLRPSHWIALLVMVRGLLLLCLLQEINKLLQPYIPAYLNHHPPLDALLQSIARVGSKQRGAIIAAQLYLGPVLSGAPLHSHGPAINVLVQGVKLWTLLPPGRDLYTNIHPWEWIATDMSDSNENPNNAGNNSPSGGERATRSVGTGGGCSVVQKAGQALYVPRHWTHQVLYQSH